MNLLLPLIMASVIASATGPSDHLSTRLVATALKVHDGDTFTAQISPWPGLTLTSRIRIANIDTPESGARAKCDAERMRAKEATKIARQMLPSGSKVLLSNIRHGKFAGRLIADVWLKDGKNYADQLLKLGVAAPWDGKGKRNKWCSIGYGRDPEGRQVRR